MTGSRTGSSITIVDVQTGASSVSFRPQQQISCFAFSQTAEELVYGMATHRLEIINISTWHWASFDFPVTITSALTLSNGIVVAKISGSSIRLSSLDKGYSPS